MINWLKAIFVTAYLVIATSITITAISQIIEQGPMIGWFGVLLANAPVVVLVGYMMLSRRMARTTRRLGPIATLVSIGVALAAVDCLQFNEDPVVLMLAITGLILFLVYVFWYSEFGQRSSDRLLVGKELPDLALTRPDGTALSSGEFKGHPTVYVFYRGNWCPLCMAQIREIAAQYRDLQSRGARVALISPQPAGKTRSIAKKFDVPVEFYVDAGGAAAKALGIYHKAALPFGLQILGYKSDGVLPTVVITDEDGVIIYVDETENYRVRPEPEMFLKVLDNHAAAAAAD